jgi:glucokinase
MASQTDAFVLADVGGTNVRFVVLKDGVQGEVDRMKVRDHATFDEALSEFLGRQPDRAAIRGALLAVAGVVKDGRCNLTNNQWVIDAAELRIRFGFASARVINDFEALAWSLPHLPRDHLLKIGGGEPAAADAPMLVFGPGTGLGVSAFVPTAGGGLVLRSEGGHATLPSGSPREEAVIAHLRQSIGHVSAERVLSGGGLENLYRAIADIDRVDVPKREAAEITQAAIDNRCPTCRAAVDMFCALLGEVAGNLALVFRAEGGVFIAGGIVRHIRDYLPQTEFRHRFDAKGRFQAYLAPIPVYVIPRGDPAFIGLQALAGQGH